MKVLVLGGTGFIGKNLCASMIKEGHEVRAFGLPTAGKDWPRIDGVEWVAGDFTCPADVAAALGDTELLFHLVSTTLPKSSNENPIGDLQDNVVSTLHLLDSMSRMSKPPKVFFISSGGTVYGLPLSVPISENHPTNPICAYGIGKLAIEKYLFLYHKSHGIDYRVLRLANPYGEFQPLDSGQGVIPVFLKKALLEEPLDIWGDGSVIRDYIHIDDVMCAINSLIRYEGEERIFNIGSGEGVSLKDMITYMERVMARTIDCRYSPARVFDVPSNILDISLARTALGWCPRVPLEEGLARMLAYVRSVLSM